MIQFCCYCFGSVFFSSFCFDVDDTVVVDVHVIVNVDTCIGVIVDVVVADVVVGTPA